MYLVLIGDTIFTSPNADGTAILLGHCSLHFALQFAVQRQYLHFSVILRPRVLFQSPESNPRPPALQSSALLGNFSNDDGDGNEDVKKAVGFLRKTTTLHVHHAFLYISLSSLHDYDVKMPNCKFYGRRKQAMTNFFFPL